MTQLLTDFNNPADRRLLQDDFTLEYKKEWLNNQDDDDDDEFIDDLI